MSEQGRKSLRDIGTDLRMSNASDQPWVEPMILALEEIDRRLTALEEAAMPLGVLRAKLAKAQEAGAGNEVARITVLIKERVEASNDKFLDGIEGRDG